MGGGVAGQVIELDVPASGILTSNQRQHWAVKARHVKALRAMGASAWARADRPTFDRVRLVVRVGYPDRRARDVHNLMPTVKALVDGMVHPYGRARGLLPDDSDRFLVGPDLRPDPGMPRRAGLFGFAFDLEPL